MVLSPNVSETASTTGKEETTGNKFDRVLLLRTLVFTSLIIAGVVCGALSYILLSDLEDEWFNEQYDSLTSEAFSEAVITLSRISDCCRVVAQIIANNYPDIDQYPYFAYPGFFDVTATLLNLGTVTAFSFLPKVLPQQTADFEEFAHNYLRSDPNFREGLGNFSFGFGIAGLNISTRQMYHDETGITFYPSPNQVLFPVLQVPDMTPGGVNARVLFNPHSHPVLGSAIDRLIECVDTSDSPDQCGSISDIIGVLVGSLNTQEPELTDAQAVLFHPILPANNRSSLAGVVNVDATFSRILSDIIPSFVHGIDCVIDTGNQIFTYSVSDGVVMFRGRGDLHDTNYNSYRRSVDLLSSITTLSSPVTFTLTIYPKRDFVDQYITERPLFTCIGVVLLMAVSLTIFYFHDYFMKIEKNETNLVIEMKRRFVRFISHEVRTPLNTVELGLSLLELELEEIDKKNSKNSEKITDKISSKTQEWLGVVREIQFNSNIAVNVLDDLLNYEKIETGTLRIHYQQLCVWNIVRDVVAAMKRQAEDKRINLELRGEKWDAATTVAKQIELKSLIVLGDSARLIQIIRTFLANSMRFTPSGGYIIVSAEWDPEGLPDASVPSNKLTTLLENTRAGSISIKVKDGGPGLNDEQIKEINSDIAEFNDSELHTGQDNRLGLIIVKDLIKKHGGMLKVMSDGIGCGATFLVELPLYSIKDSEDQDHEYGSNDFATISQKGLDELGSKDTWERIEDDRKRNKRTSFQLDEIEAQILPSSSLDNADINNHNQDDQNSVEIHKPETFLKLPNVEENKESKRSLKETNKHILIVDDAPSNRKMLSKIVERKGHSTEQAEDGQQAVDIFRAACVREGHKHPFDCILMDFEMPVMNGPTATKNIREIGYEGLIIGVSGNVLPADVKFFKKQGANAVLSKPLHMRKLEEIWKKEYK